MLRGLFFKSLFIGILLSVGLAAIPTVLHWIDNPGGVFRGAQGTRWASVIETFWSWLWPALLLAVAVAAVIPLLFAAIAAHKADRESPER